MHINIGSGNIGLKSEISINLMIVFGINIFRNNVQLSGRMKRFVRVRHSKRISMYLGKHFSGNDDKNVALTNGWVPSVSHFYQ